MNLKTRLMAAVMAVSLVAATACDFQTTKNLIDQVAPGEEPQAIEQALAFVPTTDTDRISRLEFLVETGLKVQDAQATRIGQLETINFCFQHRNEELTECDGMVYWD